MAKIIVKYKLEVSKTAPQWISDGGYWPSGHEMLGITCDTDCFWTPSNLDQLTKSEIYTWCKATGITDNDGNSLTDPQIETFVDDWLTEKGMGAYA